MTSVVQPNAWVGLKLPSENVRFLQVVPNTNISLGKYGIFPSNLIIHRPYHLTYELQDKREGESFCRLRVVPPQELHADVIADEARTATAAAHAAGLSLVLSSDAAVPSGTDTPAEEEALLATPDEALGGRADEYTLIDVESQAVIARSNAEALEGVSSGPGGSDRQALTLAEIELLKSGGATDAGRGIVERLLRSHGALDQKTSFSLAKYKLLKTKKYVRRFTVLPLDVHTLGNWLLDDKDVGAKILELRDEMVALVGCWGNVHHGGAARYLEGQGEPAAAAAAAKEEKEERPGEAQIEADAGAGEAQAPTQLPLPPPPQPDLASQLGGGRWLVVDDTGGLLVAALAERMGVLYDRAAEEQEGGDEARSSEEATADATRASEGNQQQPAPVAAAVSSQNREATPASQRLSERPARRHHAKRPIRDDFHVPFSLTNTLTLLHANAQANLAYLKYFGFDHADPSHPPHPLADHLLCLSWLQLLEPDSDTVYSQPPPQQPADVVASWKPARRGNYHRKRRRWARTRHAVDSARAGGFAGLVVATTMDLVSVLRHTLPLLAGGAPVAVYSPSLEPLAALADCFSVARRAAWSGPDPPPEIEGKTVDELERWPGSDAFPLNPMLLLGATVQTSRARRWQVLPGRTHPVMTARGGAEGYVFTGWRARPAEGRVTARGKFKKRRGAEGPL